MTTAQVNYMNIGLMLASTVVAVYVPFELFLFSYVILGPLHYLTELSWLHKRGYFFPGKKDYLILAVLCAIILFPTFLRVLDGFTDHNQIQSSALYVHARSIGKIMLFVSFAVAAVLVFVKDTTSRVIAIAIAVLIGFALRANLLITIFFTLFMPTLIHVFIFTGAFLLAGALRGRSASGILAFIVFIACALSLLLIYHHPIHQPGGYIKGAYDTGFSALNRQLFNIFLHQKAAGNEIYFSTAGILIMRFIAFAYTYHYLNWFSKTSVIKWHLIPRRSLIAVVIIWLLAVALYFTNFLVGVTALYFLSMIHVIFEFPLNFRTFKDISGAIGGFKKPSKA